jgi:hypothetical protein
VFPVRYILVGRNSVFQWFIYGDPSISSKSYFVDFMIVNSDLELRNTFKSQ